MRLSTATIKDAAVVSLLQGLFPLTAAKDVNLAPRALVNLNLTDVCPLPLACTLQLQPVFYSQSFDRETVLDPFLNGDFLTVEQVPTEVRLTSTLTTIFCVPLTSQTQTSDGPLASTPTASISTTVLPKVTSTTNDNLFIGQGLPTGQTNNLQAGTFIALAVTSIPTPPAARVQKREVEKRQGGTVDPISVVNLSPASVPGSLSQDDCDQADPLLLRNGQIIQYNRVVSKRFRVTSAIFGLLDSQRLDDVNMTFTISDGFLSWETADVSSALWYFCNGVVYAGFPGSIPPCPQVALGAFAGQACINRVRRSRDANPGFIAPSATSFGGSSASTTSQTATLTIDNNNTSSRKLSSTSLVASSGATATTSTDATADSSTSTTSSVTSTTSPTTTITPPIANTTVPTAGTISLTTTTTTSTVATNTSSTSRTSTTTTISSITSTASPTTATTLPIANTSIPTAATLSATTATTATTISTTSTTASATPIISNTASTSETLASTAVSGSATTSEITAISTSDTAASTTVSTRSTTSETIAASTSDTTADTTTSATDSTTDLTSDSTTDSTSDSIDTSTTTTTTTTAAAATSTTTSPSANSCRGPVPANPVCSP